MKDIVYLDNSSTTKPCDEAIAQINSALGEDFGNPSSLHTMGFTAQKRVQKAREAIAKMLSADSGEIYFTSGGTEGNNTAIFGAAYARRKRGNRIVTTAVEHPSVLQPVKRLEEEGFEVVRIKPESDGTISEESIFAAINSDTILVSIMLVNNETGAVMPVSAVKEAIKKAGAPALFHIDAVQAFGKIPISAAQTGADIITASGHKIHGPKGVGFMYIKRGAVLRPLILGGGQENGLRSGTEPVPAICGLYGAVIGLGNIRENLEKVQKLRNLTVKGLLEIGCVKVNSPDSALPYVLNFSVVGYRSETILHFLESRGIFVSSGSACAKGKASYVLSESGLSRDRADSAIRVSFSRFNTEDDIKLLISALSDAVNTLRKVK